MGLHKIWDTQPRIGAAGLLLLAILLPGGIARAQVTKPGAPPPSAVDAATAKRHFESGLKLYAEGAFAEALIAFEASYRLGRRASALRNVAQCQRSLKHFVDAYEAYDALLTRHGADLPEGDKGAIRNALDELALLTATVRFRVSELDADVQLDDKPLGKSPLETPKRVGVGQHKVHVTKTGFDPFDKEIALSSQQELALEVRLVPEAKTGRVVVREQNGDEVNVLLDGEDKGRAPWEGEVLEGDHVLELKGAKFAADKRTIRVKRKERIDLILDATATTGHLRITTTPIAGNIAVDGVAVGLGIWEGDLAEGAHRIEVSVPGQPNVLREVTLQRGHSFVQEVPLAQVQTAHEDYRGAYASLDLNGAFPASEPPGVPAYSGAKVDSSGRFAFGAGLHIGYAFDPFGFEFVGMFQFAHSEQRRDIQLNGFTQNEQFSINAPGFFMGVGPRVTSRDQSVRFTTGLAAGAVYRSIHLSRELNLNCTPPNCSNSAGNTSFDGQGSYATFAFLGDAGILIGSTPGTKFFLGLHYWLDFAPEIAIGPDLQAPVTDPSYFNAPGRGWTVVNAPQFFIGPQIGLQFGR